MNVFGAFTFGSLIKTFIPGFVWVVALGLIWRDLAHLLGPAVPALPDPAGQEQNALVVAIPLSVLFGLLSNIVVFMGVNDRLVRNPVRRRNAELFGLYDYLLGRLRADSWKLVACLDRAHAESFLRHADSELLILETIGLDRLIYVREQYWYHLEFQVNLILAVAALLAGLLGSPSVLVLAAAGLIRGAAEMVALGSLLVLLLFAARKNYHRHIGKMCTLMAASIGHDAKASSGSDAGIT
jgi:hypothetical protein